MHLKDVKIWRKDEGTTKLYFLKYGRYKINLSRRSSLRKYMFCFKTVFFYLFENNMHWQLTHFANENEKRKRNKTESRHRFTISFPQTVLDLTRVLFCWLSSTLWYTSYYHFKYIKVICNKLQYFIFIFKDCPIFEFIEGNKWRLISIHLDYSFRLSK